MNMGAFHVGCKIENVADRSRSATLSKVLVDTGSEYTWITESILERLGIQREKKDLAFVMANGQQITRSVGFAVIRVGSAFTVDEVVFAEKGDLLLLARVRSKGSTGPSIPAEKSWSPPVRFRRRACGWRRAIEMTAKAE